MSDHYDQLTEAERAYWDIYCRLRELSDHDGFSEAQNAIRGDARAWLVNQRKYIWRCAEGNIDGVAAGWDVNQRAERYDQLKDESLNAGECRRVCQLPTSGATPSEKSGLSEREMWWRVSSVDDLTHGWRQSNADWATNRRKQVWHLGEDEGWSEAERELRYDNLCVATKHGSPYTEWAATHNETTGEPKGSTGGKSSRSKCVDLCESFLGVHENPDGSNRGSPQPSGWQNRVYGDDGVPWCACFAVCMAWDAGATGTGTAGVWNNTDLAKRGQGIYKGYTTDPSKVHAGDHAFISDDHTGVIVDRDTMTTIEGNTSSSDAWNGGSVERKDRGPGYWTGYGLVDFPDD